MQQRKNYLKHLQSLVSFFKTTSISKDDFNSLRMTERAPFYDVIYIFNDNINGLSIGVDMPTKGRDSYSIDIRSRELPVYQCTDDITSEG